MRRVRRKIHPGKVGCFPAQAKLVELTQLRAHHLLGHSRVAAAVVAYHEVAVAAVFHAQRALYLYALLSHNFQGFRKMGLFLVPLGLIHLCFTSAFCRMQRPGFVCVSRRANAAAQSGKKGCKKPPLFRKRAKGPP